MSALVLFTPKPYLRPGFFIHHCWFCSLLCWVVVIIAHPWRTDKHPPPITVSTPTPGVCGFSTTRLLFLWCCALSSPAATYTPRHRLAHFHTKEGIEPSTDPHWASVCHQTFSLRLGRAMRFSAPWEQSILCLSDLQTGAHAKRRSVAFCPPPGLGLCAFCFPFVPDSGGQVIAHPDALCSIGPRLPGSPSGRLI